MIVRAPAAVRFPTVEATVAAAGRALERVRCLGLAIRHELAAAIKNVAPERRRVVAEALLVLH